MKLHNLLFIFIFISFIPAAFAQPASDLEQCRTIIANPELAIRHCTRAIESGKLAQRDLALAYYYRGMEKSSRNDHDGAIADYDAALKADPKYIEVRYGRGVALAHKGESARAIADFDAFLKTNPKHADALHSRGTEHMVGGDYKRAVADFDAALRANPKGVDVYFARGRAHFYAGDYPRAIDDFAKAHQVEPGDYTALWLFLARGHGGDANAGTLLDRDTRATRDPNWPRGIISLYMGQEEPDRALKLAEADLPAKRAEHLCEARFYVAHWHLLRKAVDPARALLEEAQRSCPRTVIEYEGTLATLRRLKAQ